jgi:hypothetical protein
VEYPLAGGRRSVDTLIGWLDLEFQTSLHHRLTNKLGHVRGAA